MRRDAQEDLALAHVASHQTEVEELEVAQPAVDQPRRSRGRSRGEISLFDERDRKTAEGGITRDPRADDAAADDQKVDGAVGDGPRRLVPRAAYLFALLYLSI